MHSNISRAAIHNWRSGDVIDFVDLFNWKSAINFKIYSLLRGGNGKGWIKS